MDVQELAKIALQPMLEGITYQERKALPSTSTQVSIECPMVAITTAVNINVQTYRIESTRNNYALFRLRPPGTARVGTEAAGLAQHLTGPRPPGGRAAA